MPEDQYTHGHHRSVVEAHATRTIANSAAYLEPHLVPGAQLLDVGCGPGSITVEFGARVGDENVLGIDLGADVIEQAAAAYADRGIRFEVQDLYALDADDDTYDIVHAHQVLQHVSDPVAALAEMKRVCKPGGTVAVRDADYAAMHWAPQSDRLDEWQRIYRAVAYANDAEPDAGRWLLGWARQAGFTDITPSIDTWLFADDASREWWGGTWSRRVIESALAAQAVEMGIASSDELEVLSAGWQDWLAEPDGWFVVVHGQLLCRA
ncbi:MAG: methyltransferase domain-containing protein [Actinomycetota bacterium]